MRRDATAEDEPAGRTGPGGAPAFDIETLFRLHFDFVWRSLRRLGVAESALDDATQEVFLVAYRRIGDLHHDSTPRAWLFAIAQRVASTQRRSARRKGEHEPLEPDAHTAHGTPLDHALVRETGDMVLAFLDTLEPGLRSAFILSELEQLTAPEISRALDVNVNTIYYRIASARKAFNAFVAACAEPEETES
jgi:RNA polymerase sigma-70 factor, ECF subfamily